MSIQEAGLKEKTFMLLKYCKALKKKGKIQKALEALEEGFKATKHKNAQISLKIAYKLARISNLLYMSSNAKVPLLRKAEAAVAYILSFAAKSTSLISDKILKVVLVTYNNWASFHKSGKNYSMALMYLMRAFDISKNFNSDEADSYHIIAKTQLNISSFYAELSKYELSVKMAERCLETLQKESKLRLPENLDSESLTEHKKFKDMITTYVLAFYSIAMTQEALHKQHLAKEALVNAIEIGTKFLGTDGPIMSTVINALYDSDKCPISRVALGLIPEDRKTSNTENMKKHRLSQLSLLIPASDVELRHETQSFGHYKSEPKLPGRYYTSKELKQKQGFISEKKNLKFISADDYFFHEISKGMNVQSDIKHLKSSNSANSKSWIKVENLEKRVISDLRLRKQYRSRNPHSQIPQFTDKIQSLKLADNEHFKEQSKKIDRLTNSLECKKLIKQICDRGAKRKYFPDQSKRYLELFFKPKVIIIETQSEEEELWNGNETGEDKESDQKGRRNSCFQVTKDEIESMIDIVAEEINTMKTERSTSKLSSPKDALHHESKLSMSALKISTENDTQFTILKSAIEKSLKAKKKHKMQKFSKSPKFIDLEV